MVEYRRDEVPRSDYHSHLETSEVTSSQNKMTAEATEEDIRADDSKIRYWADYSRVFLHPRTVQRLPDLPEWDSALGDWVKGREEFERMDEVGDCYIPARAVLPSAFNFAGDRPHGRYIPLLCRRM